MHSVARDDAGTWWATLTVDGQDVTMIYGSSDDFLTTSWHGYITRDGVTERISIDPQTWVLAFHECDQPWTVPA